MNALSNAWGTVRGRVRGLTSGLSSRWDAMSKWQKRSAWALLVVCLYTAPQWPNIPLLGPLVDTPGTKFETVLSDQVIIFVLVALGLNVVVGLAGLLDLGYVGFYAVGAYTTAVLTSQHASLPWLVALPISVAVSMIVGVILGTPTLRLRGDYLAIVTLGFGEIIRLSAKNLEWLGGNRGISNIAQPPDMLGLTFGVLDAKPYYYLGLTLVLIVIFVLHRLEYSRVGRAWTAVREDEDAAELMGVDTFKFKLWAFAIGAAVGGLAGVQYAGKVGFVSPDNFPLLLSILFLAAVVLGGSGNMYGAIMGGIMVAWLPERFRDFADKRVFVFGVALVLVMVFRPEGLFPRRVGHKSRADAVPTTGEVAS